MVYMKSAKTVQRNRVSNALGNESERPFLNIYLEVHKDTKIVICIIAGSRGF